MANIRGIHWHSDNCGRAFTMAEFCKACVKMCFVVYQCNRAVSSSSLLTMGLTWPACEGDGTGYVPESVHVHCGDLSPLEQQARMGWRHGYSPHVPVASPSWPSPPQPSAPLPAHCPSGLHCSVQEYSHHNWTLDRGCTRDSWRCSLQDTAGVGAILAKWLFPLMDPRGHGRGTWAWGGCWNHGVGSPPPLEHGSDNC